MSPEERSYLLGFAPALLDESVDSLEQRTEDEFEESKAAAHPIPTTTQPLL